LFTAVVGFITTAEPLSALLYPKSFVVCSLSDVLVASSMSDVLIPNILHIRSFALPATFSNIVGKLSIIPGINLSNVQSSTLSPIVSRPSQIVFNPLPIAGKTSLIVKVLIAGHAVSVNQSFIFPKIGETLSQIILAIDLYTGFPYSS